MSRFLLLLPIHTLLLAACLPFLLVGFCFGVVRVVCHLAGHAALDTAEWLCDLGVSLTRWAR